MLLSVVGLFFFLPAKEPGRIVKQHSSLYKTAVKQIKLEIEKLLVKSFLFFLMFV